MACWQFYLFQERIACKHWIICSYYLDRTLPLSIVLNDWLKLDRVVIAMRMILILNLVLYTDLYYFIFYNYLLFYLKIWLMHYIINTLRTGDADLRFYITTVQDRWRKSAFLTRACFPCTIHLIMQYIEPVSEWSCWRMFIETWPHSELTFKHRASSI